MPNGRRDRLRTPWREVPLHRLEAYAPWLVPTCGLDGTPTEEPSQLQDSEHLELMLSLVRMLPPERVALLTEYYWQGMSLRELAELHECSHEAIRKRLRRTVEKLRLAMEVSLAEKEA